MPVIIEDLKKRLITFQVDTKRADTVVNASAFERMIDAYQRYLIWKGLLVSTHTNDKSLYFLHAAHSKCLEIFALLSTGLEHSAYATLRSIMDSVISFTYYTDHQIEFASLARGENTWISRYDIMNYHLRYRNEFQKFNNVFRVHEKLNTHYSALSSYIHCLPDKHMPFLDNLECRQIPVTRMEKYMRNYTSVFESLNLLLLGLYNRQVPILNADDYQSVMRGTSRKRLAEAGVTLPSP